MLRVVLAVDAAVLVAFGGAFMVVPGKVLEVFGFHDLPVAVGYIVGLWGCAMISLGIGYALAIGNPARNVNWVRAGIVRGALECMFGFAMVGQQLVTWKQAGLGTILAGIIAAAYLILYPAEAA
jgi:hypothetical protein